MAVMQTPHGRVIGLILQEEDQPKVEASEKNNPSASLRSAPPLSGEAKVEAKVEAKPATTAKRGGRATKK